MKKILILLSLLIIGLGTVYYFSQSTNPKTIALTPDRDFKVPNYEDVGRVFIAYRNGETVDLKKVDNVWYVNDSIKANPGVMIGILDAAKNMEIKYEPTQKAHEYALKTMVEDGILVEYFDSKGKKLKSYMLGSSTDGGTGNFAIIEGQNKAMVVKVRNAPTDLRMHFKKVHYNSWYDLTFIAYEVEDMKKVAIDFKYNQKESFEINKSESEYVIKPLNPTVEIINDKVHPNIFRSYFTNFEKVGSEGILDYDRLLVDSLSNEEPWYHVYIESVDGYKQDIYFYPIIKEKDREDIRELRKSLNDIERFFVIDRENNGLYTAQKRVFEKILWGYSSFMEASKNVKTE